MRKIVMAGLVVAIMLAGCANEYREFYHPVLNPATETAQPLRAELPSAEPVVERGGLINGGILDAAYFRRGYFRVGVSSFNGVDVPPESDAIDQAKKVGADIVYIGDPKFTGVGTAVVHRYSTSPGMVVSSYVPIAVDRMDFGAVFYAKGRFRVGILSTNLPDNLRKQLQTNKGILVRAVADGSPMFNADILVGDVITIINGRVIENAIEARSAWAHAAGSTAVSIVRDGQKMQKTVMLPPMS